MKYSEMDSIISHQQVTIGFLRYCLMRGLTLRQTVNIAMIAKALNLDLNSGVDQVLKNPDYLKMLDEL